MRMVLRVFDKDFAGGKVDAEVLGVVNAADIADQDPVDIDPDVVVAGELIDHVLVNAGRVQHLTVGRDGELRLHMNTEEIGVGIAVVVARMIRERIELTVCLLRNGEFSCFGIQLAVVNLRIESVVTALIHAEEFVGVHISPLGRPVSVIIVILFVEQISQAFTAAGYGGVQDRKSVLQFPLHDALVYAVAAPRPLVPAAVVVVGVSPEPKGTVIIVDAGVVVGGCLRIGIAVVDIIIEHVDDRVGGVRDRRNRIAVCGQRGMLRQHG